MKVGVVVSDVPPCEYYRGTFAGRALAAAGEIEFMRLSEQLKVRYAVRRHGLEEIEPVGLAEVPDVDVVVFTRGVFPSRMHDIVKFLQREGVAVVIDYDDAYDRLPAELQSLYKINPSTNPYYNWQNAIDAAKLAEVVTVSTPALKRYRQDAVVLPNCVPKRYVELGRKTERERDGKLVGWSGTIAGHPGDLRQCGAGVDQALLNYGASFLNVGDGVDVQDQLGLRHPPEVTGIVSFDEYPKHIARLDVSIAPLVLDSYRHEAKSFLKPLEALAMGSQYVASPSLAYEQLQGELERWCAQNVSPVPGAIATSKGRVWRSRLSEALRRAQDERERAELAEAARRFVIDTYLVEENAWRWAEAWELALTRRRSKMLKGAGNA